MIHMVNVAVVGYGNVGKYAVGACLDAPDMELVGIVSKRHAGETAANKTIVTEASELPPFDVALLTAYTRLVPDTAAELLARGVSTVDSFDIHGEIPALRKRLDPIAKQGGAVAVIAAGWDPGSDSVVRALMLAMAPQGITYTNFGPGLSMGHSVAAKAIAGVKDALSITIPTGAGVHRRMVYVELEDGYALEQVAAAIKADDYFAHDETHVRPVDSVNALRDVGHGVLVSRKGVAAAADNQLLSYQATMNGPALTAQVMVSAARAAARQEPGCYTMIEIPPVDLLPMSREDAVRALV